MEMFIRPKMKNSTSMIRVYLLFMKIYWNWKIVLLFILGNLVGVVHCGPYNPSDNSKKTLRTRLVAIRSCSAPRGPSYVGAFWGNTILQCSCILFYSIFFFALNDDLFHFFLPCFIFKTIAHLIRPNFRSNLSPTCVYTHMGPKQHYGWEYARGYHYKEKIFYCLQMYMS